MPVPPTRRRRTPGIPRMLFAGLVCAGLIVPTAGGHAVVRPAASRPAELQQYTITVPNEREVSTVEVDLKVPAGIGFLLVQEAPGWQIQVIRRNGRIDEIRWTGSEIPPDHFAAFRLIARNPVEEGEIAWPIVQRYEGGEVVRWIGGEGSETPAARTTITENAAPVDVVDIVSGRATDTGSADDPSEATEDSSTAGRDGLTLGIAIGAALAGVLALGLALVGGRRSRSTGQTTERR